jgi:hypothetical protein
MEQMMKLLKLLLCVFFMTALCSCETKMLDEYVDDRMPNILEGVGALTVKVLPDVETWTVGPLQSKCRAKGNKVIMPFAYVGDKFYFCSRVGAGATVLSLGIAAQTVLMVGVLIEGTPFFVAETFKNFSNVVRSSVAVKPGDVVKPGDSKSERMSVPQTYEEGIPAKDYKEHFSERA